MKFTVTAEEAGSRLDSLLALHLSVSRSRAAALADAGEVYGDGKRLSKSEKVKKGCEITCEPPAAEPLQNAAPEDIPLAIVYEDQHLLVINKPKGMVVHPAAGHAGGTLVNALLAHCGDSLSGINGVMRPGIVHRIDKDTSGLLVVAKTDAAHQSLAAQIKAHTCRRTYEAVLCGHLKEAKITVDAPLGRSTKDRKKQAVTESGRPAVTHFEVLAEYPGYTHIRARLETGRTHQIRVHAAYLGHPVLGDAVYGGARKEFAALVGQTLHAAEIEFTHPESGEPMHFSAPLPDYFEEVLRKLENR